MSKEFLGLIGLRVNTLLILQNKEPVLGIYLKENKSGYNKDTFTPMFITALFTIAKLWKQPRYPIPDE
jgi:hypothetical protein